LVKHSPTPEAKSNELARVAPGAQIEAAGGKPELFVYDFAAATRRCRAPQNEREHGGLPDIFRYPTSGLAKILSKQHVTESTCFRCVNRGFTVTDKPNIYRAI
jgi:hypothetical protein